MGVFSPVLWDGGDDDDAEHRSIGEQKRKKVGKNGN